jgi:tRNA (guanine37-N1)-methyltransferase
VVGRRRRRSWRSVWRGLCLGVVGKQESLEHDSFYHERLLGPPQYTRPPEFRGLRVPEVLLSGDHKKIEEFRRRAALEKTLKNRPDLLQK